MTSRKHRLTASLCGKLAGPEPGSSSKSTEYSDELTQRLKFTVTQAGLRIWWWRYVFDGCKAAIRIGEFPGIGVEEARNKAREYGAMLDRGEDPKRPRQLEKRQPIFSEFATDFYLPYATQRKRSVKDDESKLRNHLFKRFGHHKLRGITRYEIEDYLAKIASSHCAATSNRHLSLLQRMFNLAIGWEMMATNPCAGVKKLAERSNVHRDLKPHEISALQDAMHGESNRTAATALEVLMFSGLRLREVLNARWEHLDLAEGRLHLPTTKTGARTVTLNDTVIGILKGIPRDLDNPWIFPGKDPARPIHNVYKAWHRALAAAKLEKSRIHSLRHQFATTCIRAGVPIYTVSGLLGHSSVITTQKYAHHCNNTLKAASQAAADLLNQRPANPKP